MGKGRFQDRPGFHSDAPECLGQQHGPGNRRVGGLGHPHSAGLGTVEVEGFIGWDLDFEFTGSTGLTLGSFTLANASFTFGNQGAALEGNASVIIPFGFA